MQPEVFNEASIYGGPVVHFPLFTFDVSRSMSHVRRFTFQPVWGVVFTFWAVGQCEVNVEVNNYTWLCREAGG